MFTEAIKLVFFSMRIYPMHFTCIALKNRIPSGFAHISIEKIKINHWQYHLDSTVIKQRHIKHEVFLTSGLHFKDLLAGLLNTSLLKAL